MNQKKNRRIVAAVNIYRSSEQPKERSFWLTKTPEERLTALEEIRKEHHHGDHEYQRRLRRVVRITKQT
jgi:hypothetical protein